MKPQMLTILGATGTIGVSTLQVVGLHPQRYQIYALTAHHNIDRLADQCAAFSPCVAVVGSAAQVDPLNQALRTRRVHPVPEILWGPEALAQVACADPVTTVMAGIVGAAGLMPTLAAASAGKKLLLANKEALVMSGALMMDAVRRSGAQLLPVDSEHNAVFQCWPQGHGQAAGVEKILLTASGGPFLEMPLEALARVTPEQACRHPKWRMGKKISVDSATMMNKGLELIEACWLFDLSPERVEILIHPQSLVHSLVAYQDGSLLAQLGHTDMRVPISHALAWPERHTSGVPLLDLTTTGPLTFLPLDRHRFPSVDLAEQAIRAGGSAPAVLNAANEVAVAAFLEGRLGFRDIPYIIAATLEQDHFGDVADLDSLIDVDVRARVSAAHQIESRGR
ncbi:MAG: 1-deoxy-D-xylulose-5-phosphate reductoisomerase [Betaproteobacteria bacterium]|jgi:1-deoxy-D-xylulose 5-phosphate reductoisomerase (EC 1.1.1.267)|nr:1-deoxy-D-xylulose-5-phosphate reductoisomerase [Betaproteobacteria bacterium]